MYARSCRSLIYVLLRFPTGSKLPRTNKPRDIRIHSEQAMTRLAWSCGGRHLAAIGVDKVNRSCAPETSVRMLHYVHSLAHADLRWSKEPQHISPEAILTMEITYREIQPTPSCSVHPVRDRHESFSGTRDVSTRADDLLQKSQFKVSPVRTNCAPDGKSLLYAFAGHQSLFLTCGKGNHSFRDVWQIPDKDGVSDTPPLAFKESSTHDMTIRPLSR